MINRVWHGWKNRENADAYQQLLRTGIFANIAERSIQGYRGIHLLRRDFDGEVDLVTIMWFDSPDAVRAFAGEEYEVAVVRPRAKRFLSRFDSRSAHYQVIETPGEKEP